MLTGPLGTKFSEILIKIWQFSCKRNVFENVVCKTLAICVPATKCLAHITTKRPSLHECRLHKIWMSIPFFILVPERSSLAAYKAAPTFWYHMILLNPLAPGRFGSNFEMSSLNTCYREYSWTFLVKLLSNEFHRTSLMIWTLVLVIVQCHQATDHMLSQSWLRSMAPYDTTIN